MIFKCPEYALKFKCKAGACSDSCCIGWEIGVDTATRDYYLNGVGSLCEKVKKHLKTDGDYCTVRLLEDGRCPMLDGDGLCEIIKELSDAHIPEICREHPRFYSPLPHCCEWGVGLSCEEAARLILTDKSRRLVISHTDGAKINEKCDTVMHFMLFSRDRMLELIDFSPLPILDKARSLILYAHALSDSAERGEYGVMHPFIPLNGADFLDTGAEEDASDAYAEMIRSLCEMDFLDIGFKDRLLAAASSVASAGYAAPDADARERLEGLLHYFIYRYFITADADLDICAKIKLAVVLTLAVYALVGNGADTETWIYAARALSREAEYNEDNLDLILEMILTEQAFSTDSLMKILSGARKGPSL